MKGKKADIAELTEWLRKRMTEEDLSAEEVSEFTAWLNSASCNERSSSDHKRHEKISLLDVIQLVDWLKKRMDDHAIGTNDKQGLITWLKQRLSAHHELSERSHRQIDESIEGID